MMSSHWKIFSNGTSCGMCSRRFRWRYRCMVASLRQFKREETGTDKARTGPRRAPAAKSRTRCGPSARASRREHRARRNESQGRHRKIYPGFVIRHQHGETPACRIILATGSRSLPRTGSDGGGYELVRHLGHHVTPTVPALVALMLDEGLFFSMRSFQACHRRWRFRRWWKGDRSTGVEAVYSGRISASAASRDDASRFRCLARSRGETAEVAVLSARPECGAGVKNGSSRRRPRILAGHCSKDACRSRCRSGVPSALPSRRWRSVTGLRSGATGYSGTRLLRPSPAFIFFLSCVIAAGTSLK